MWTTLLTFALVASSANAFFRMPCDSVIRERADPIVSPGVASGHQHTVVGGNAFNFTESYDDARKSTCGSCKAKQDLSNYWFPDLWYHAQNGSFHQVNQVGGALVYYLQRPNNDNAPLIAFPEGFRMLAGDPTVRSYNASSLSQQAVQFVCLDYAGSGAGYGPSQIPPDHSCPDGLRTQIFFPSCWDGVNVDSTDHKSHVAYPDGVDHGQCPPDHPHRLISIFVEIIWDTNPWKDMWYDGKPPFVLSTGDPTLYGYHGDFLNGWDVPSLEAAIAGCTQDSGVIEDCQNVLELRSDDDMNDCVLPNSVDEVSTGWLPALPGCNPVQAGPGKATSVAGCPVTPILSAAESSFLKSDIPGWQPLGCAIDSLSNRLLSAERYTPGGMTIEMCTSYCGSKNYKYAGLEWAQECYCSNTLDTSAIGQYACNTPCQGDSSEYCGGSLRLAVYEQGNTPPPPVKSSTTTKPASTLKTTTTSKATTPTTAKMSTTTTSKKSTTTSKNTATTASQATSTPPADGSTAFTSPNSLWSSLGCYYDSVSTRVLQGTNLWAGVPMTTEACLAYCHDKGFPLAGTEYGRECYCGNILEDSEQIADSKCTMQCAGDSKETCGGPGALNLYQLTVGAPCAPVVKRRDHRRHAARHGSIY